MVLLLHDGGVRSIRTRPSPRFIEPGYFAQPTQRKYLTSYMALSTRLTYICNRERFRPAALPSVRWLAPQADFYRYEQMLLTRGVAAPVYDIWLEWHTHGYGFAAYVRQGTVLSVGVVLRQPEGDWQLAGVRTLDAYAGNGYATAVSSFLTNYIVNERGRAACELVSTDTAMCRILEKLGYELVIEPGNESETGG